MSILQIFEKLGEKKKKKENTEKPSEIQED